MANNKLAMNYFPCIQKNYSGSFYAHCWYSERFATWNNAKDATALIRLGIIIKKMFGDCLKAKISDRNIISSPLNFMRKRKRNMIHLIWSLNRQSTAWQKIYFVMLWTGCLYTRTLESIEISFTSCTVTI